MKKLEIILIIGALIGLLLTLGRVPFNSLIVTIFFTALGCFYFYLGFALFNGISFRRMFKAESYHGLWPWRIMGAIGTGITMSVLSIGYMFSILSYPMAGTFLILGIIFAAIIIIMALIKNAQAKSQFYRNIILRSLVFLVIAVIFLLLPTELLRRA